MTVNQRRRFAIQWLLHHKRIPSHVWKGLDPGRLHFECSCSILQPRSFLQGRPAFHSRVCEAHQAALGSGEAL